MRPVGTAETPYPVPLTRRFDQKHREIARNGNTPNPEGFEVSAEARSSIGGESTDVAKPFGRGMSIDCFTESGMRLEATLFGTRFWPDEVLNASLDSGVKVTVTPSCSEPPPMRRDPSAPSSTRIARGSFSARRSLGFHASCHCSFRPEHSVRPVAARAERF
jgi:hypothetical protein